MPRGPDHSKNWGGARPRSGPKKQRIAPVPDAAPSQLDLPGIPKVPAAPINQRFADLAPELIEAFRAMNTKQTRIKNGPFDPFKLPAFPPGAMPPEKVRMAMDEQLDWAATQWSGAGGGLIDAYIAEGLMFPGYTYLSELAQRSEFRVLSETIADDATRAWVNYETVSSKTDPKKRQRMVDSGGDPDEREKQLKDDGKLDKVKQLRDDQESLGVKNVFYDLIRDDGQFGRTHLFTDLGDDLDMQGTANPELAVPIGNGRDDVSKAKIAWDGKIGKLRAFRTVEPIWCYPTTYNAMSPLRHDYYNPQVWYVMGQNVAISRLRPFVTRPVPDILKAAYAFGGISMSQLAEPYVNIWLQTRQSVANLVKGFSTMVLQADLAQNTTPGGQGANSLISRALAFNAFRDNMGLFVVDKNKEDVKNVAAPLGGLEGLQAQSQEHMASVGRQPLVKLTGISPSGLNATSEFEVKVYDDTINAFQNRRVRPMFNFVFWMMQLNRFGEIDPEITYDFAPLRQMTEQEKAEKQEREAKRDEIWVNIGAISAEEVRKRIIDDPELPFGDLDPDDVPEPPAQEEGEMMPGGEGGDDEHEGEGSTSSAAAERPGGADSVVPFALDAAGDFDESKHPRDPDGKFSKGGAGSAGNAPISATGLKKVGEQKGSNPGGVYQDKTGKEFYLKKLKSPHHAASEVYAANLFKIAGGNTLEYHQVGTTGMTKSSHVATAMTKLDKGNLSQLSPEEKKQAQKDFVANAWLANWDAAGTGGDNVGIVNGKATTLDFGGSLAYRAQGEPKGAAFASTVGELDSMRDPKISPDNFKLYGSMTKQDIIDSAKRVTSIPNKDIIIAGQNAGASPELVKKLLDRKKDIAEQFGLETDVSEFDESKYLRNPDGTFKAKNLPEEPTIEKPKSDDDDVPKPGGYGGLWKGKGTDATADFLYNAGFYSTAKAQIGIHYRRMMAKILKDSDKHGLNAEQKDKIKGKLIESLQASAAKAQAQGKTAEVDKINAAIAKLGGMPPAQSSPSQLQKFSPKFAAAAQEIDGKGSPPQQAAVLKAHAAIASGDATAHAFEQSLSQAEKDAIALSLKMTPASLYKWAQDPSKAPKKAAAPAPKPEPEPALPTPTPEEMKKAGKGTPIPSSMASSSAAQDIIKGFNDKYAGKELTDPAAIAQKIADYKKLTSLVQQVDAAYQAETQKKAQAAAQAKATEMAAKAKAEAAAHAQKNAAVMKDLGISEQDAEGFNALVEMLGGSQKDVVASFKGYEAKAAKHGYPITGFQAALISNYSNGGFGEVNNKLRSGAWTPAQHVYVKMVNKALAGMPAHTGTLTRNTSLTTDQLSKYLKVGHVIQEDAFMSTSTSSVFSGNVQFKVTGIGKRGASIKKLSNHPTEDEVLFQARTFFKIDKVEKQGNTHVIHMTEWED